MTKHYKDVYYQSADGLTLYARDYENPGAKHTLMMLHGFTRNSADFSDLCEELRSDYRIIVPDQRGRGLSEYDKNTANYNPAVYIGDMFKLLQEVGVPSVMAIGTSMGGVIAMSMASMNAAAVPAVILNDVGPEVNADGLVRVIALMGNKPQIDSWQDAVDYAKKINGEVYPDYTDDQWDRFTQNIFRLNENGKPVATYDPGIAEPNKDFDPHATPMNIWPVFDAAKAASFMVIRGESSDILTRECFDKLDAQENVLSTVEVPRVGHAPMLDETGVVDSIREFLSKIQ